MLEDTNSLDAPHIIMHSVSLIGELGLFQIKHMGVFEGKALNFCGVGGVGFHSSGWLSFMKM